MQGLLDPVVVPLGLFLVVLDAPLGLGGHAVVVVSGVI